MQINSTQADADATADASAGPSESMLTQLGLRLGVVSYVKQVKPEEAEPEPEDHAIEAKGVSVDNNEHILQTFISLCVRVSLSHYDAYNIEPEKYGYTQQDMVYDEEVDLEASIRRDWWYIVDKTRNESNGSKIRERKEANEDVIFPPWIVALLGPIRGPIMSHFVKEIRNFERLDDQKLEIPRPVLDKIIPWSIDHRAGVFNRSERRGIVLWTGYSSSGLKESRRHMMYFKSYIKRLAESGVFGTYLFNNNLDDPHYHSTPMSLIVKHPKIKRFGLGLSWMPRPNGSTQFWHYVSRAFIEGTDTTNVKDVFIQIFPRPDKVLEETILVRFELPALARKINKGYKPKIKIVVSLDEGSTAKLESGAELSLGDISGFIKKCIIGTIEKLPVPEISKEEIDQFWNENVTTVDATFDTLNAIWETGGYPPVASLLKKERAKDREELVKTLFEPSIEKMTRFAGWRKKDNIHLKMDIAKVNDYVTTDGRAIEVFVNECRTPSTQRIANVRNQSGELMEVLVIVNVMPWSLGWRAWYVLEDSAGSLTLFEYFLENDAAVRQNMDRGYLRIGDLLMGSDSVQTHLWQPEPKPLPLDDYLKGDGLSENQFLGIFSSVLKFAPGKSLWRNRAREEIIQLEFILNGEYSKMSAVVNPELDETCTVGDTLRMVGNGGVLLPRGSKGVVIMDGNQTYIRFNDVNSQEQNVVVSTKENFDQTLFQKTFGSSRSFKVTHYALRIGRWSPEANWDASKTANVQSDLGMDENKRFLIIALRLQVGWRFMYYNEKWKQLHEYEVNMSFDHNMGDLLKSEVIPLVGYPIHRWRHRDDFYRTDLPWHS